MNRDVQSQTIGIWLFVTIAAICAGFIVIMTDDSQPLPQTPEIQYSVDIYRHYTVYTDRINGNLSVVEIDLDSTYLNGCDGWITYEDNGHNCVVVGSAEIWQIIIAYNLDYDTVKGE